MLFVTNLRFMEGPSGTLPDGSPRPPRSVILDPDGTLSGGGSEGPYINGEKRSRWVEPDGGGGA